MKKYPHLLFFFIGVNTVRDVAILEYCSRKFYQFAISKRRIDRNENPNGAEIEIVLKKRTESLSADILHKELSLSIPLVLRISESLTVNGLRKLLMFRFSRFLREWNHYDRYFSETSNKSRYLPCHNNQKTDYTKPFVNVEPKINPKSDMSLLYCPDNLVTTKNIDIFSRIPLTYERKSIYSYSKNSLNQRLGAIPNLDDNSVNSLILINREEEKLVLETVGRHGKVYVHWPRNTFNIFFDEKEFDKVVDIQPKKYVTISNTISVEDCISKFCQMEQLEETEMWYCNRCKEHVRAWKQYHLYRTPPILIIHLKRFQFSPFSHKRDKIDSFIDFPLKGLDLRKEVIFWESGEEPIYDCYAISNHYGGLGGGHYTAYAQSDGGNWCYFDDSKVITCVNENEVVSSAAYVLYYRRKDIEFGD